ncbi:MAG: NAD(P)-dependent alcohol dehydrogenase [Chloroflexota bacterium]|nr:MAG: NAD(P)-dependent alcohol dehydrogenase [Chloroflexota bacterium]
MKAIVQDQYGSEDALRLREIERPTVGEGEVLVRVHAASIHVGDLLVMAGRPILMRMATGLRRPRQPILGTDVAGTVAAVGSGVTRFKVGDEVFGWTSGAFAEYSSTPEDHLATKPAHLTFEQAAAVGVSATAALQLLRDEGQVKPGQKVLVNGASGGVGTYAVQIAKAFGAEVTGVTSTRNADLVRSIGADHVIDYTRQDFTKGTERYDFILDNVANHSLGAMRRALTPTGVLLPNGGGHQGGGMGRLIRATIASMFIRGQGRPSVKFENAADLAVLAELAEAGRITPVIDRTYPLSDTAAALRHVGTGRARGTVVITVAAPAPGTASQAGAGGAVPALTAGGVA